MKSLIRLLLALALIGSLHAEGPPNVVLIISDDQSWTDYGFMGHETIETPRLDQLAAQSLTYTRGYVAAPLCRPSLASMFTGVPPHLHGITGNDLLGPDGKKAGRGSAEGARLHEKLYEKFRECPGLANELGKAGYLSLQTGKWWESDPKKSGFTHAMTHADPKRGGRHGDAGLKISRDGIEPIKDFLDEAAREKKPFFIWHAPFLPHTPHNPPKDLLAKYLKKVDSPAVARYYAMVEWFDQTCGELLDELDRRKLTENTVVLYVTDNGWIQSERAQSYAPLSKQDIHEGGIRTPIMVKWPGELAPLRNDATLVSALDLAPTILNLAGVKVPETMPGIDLRDTGALAKRNMVFAADHSHDIKGVDQRVANLESRCVIKGPWKLIIHNQDNFPPPAYAGKPNGKKDNPEGKPELYNLLKDPHELKNLAGEMPDEVTALRKDLDAWWDGTDPSK